MKSKHTLTMIVGIVLSTISLQAEILNVPADYPDIRSAVEAAHYDDEVVLADGTYFGENNRNIEINNGIKIRSKNGPENCIIDLSSYSIEPDQYAFRIYGRVTIEGITIQNGLTHEGGAIYCMHTERVSIINCTFKNNNARRGGAVFCEYSEENITFINCRFHNNVAEEGGAIYTEEASIHLMNCSITENRAKERGAGICLSGRSISAMSSLNRCVINGNELHNPEGEAYGAGIFCSADSKMDIHNTKITNNAIVSYEGYGAGVNIGYRHSPRDEGDFNILSSTFSNNVIISERSAIGAAFACLQTSSVKIDNSDLSDNTCKSHFVSGAGLYLHNWIGIESQIISNSTIAYNKALPYENEPHGHVDGAGGGAYFFEASPIISNCIIKGNQHVQGSALCFEGWEPTIYNCLISGNISKYHEYAAIDIRWGKATIQNCTIVGNKSFAIRCEDDASTISNSILYYNRPWGSDEVPQIECSAETTIKNCNIQSLDEPWINHNGNIDTDPCFVDPGYWDANGTPHDWEDDFWIEGDYHLLSVSPCIDSNGPTSGLISPYDLDGKPRIHGSSIDMGVYEYAQTEPPQIPPVADAGEDQTVFAYYNGTANVTLDGTNSYDENGDTLSYVWQWNLGNASGPTPAITLPVGTHQIALVVNDSTHESQPDTVTVTVEEAVGCTMYLLPRRLNLKRQGRWIYAMFVLPEWISAEDINNQHPLTMEPFGLECNQSSKITTRRGNTILWAKFDSQQVLQHVTPPSQHIHVFGRLISGQYFYGEQMLQIIP